MTEERKGENAGLILGKRSWRLHGVLGNVTVPLIAREILVFPFLEQNVGFAGLAGFPWPTVAPQVFTVKTMSPACLSRLPD